ncbi:MAG TPA: hypothetical protein VGK90_01790 [Rhizomicrobium sp.]
MHARSPFRSRSANRAEAAPREESVPGFSGQNSADDVLAEIGLVLVVVLGVVLAINAVLISLHVAP